MTCRLCGCPWPPRWGPSSVASTSLKVRPSAVRDQSWWTWPAINASRHSDWLRSHPSAMVVPMTRLRTIAVGFDGSSDADTAVHWAMDVASQTGADLAVVHAVGLLEHSADPALAVRLGEAVRDMATERGPRPCAVPLASSRWRPVFCPAPGGGRSRWRRPLGGRFTWAGSTCRAPPRQHQSRVGRACHHSAGDRADRGVSGSRGTSSPLIWDDGWEPAYRHSAHGRLPRMVGGFGMTVVPDRHQVGA